jgi:hypothetical protein
MKHHPLRTNEYTLSYNNEEVEEDEEEGTEEGDDEDEENSDWIVGGGIYNISRECYAIKNSALLSQANPSSLSDIEILYVKKKEKSTLTEYRLLTLISLGP